MSWRSVQLGNSLCDQDQKILDLFAGQPVRYIGNDLMFKQIVGHRQDAPNLVLIINQPMWCSDIINLIEQQLDTNTQKFYIGINRYCIKGNDTDCNFRLTGQFGFDIVNMISAVVNNLDFSVISHGHYDNDRGQHFNFVQPLTWIYGIKKNQSN